LFAGAAAPGLTAALREPQPVIGEPQVVTVQLGQTLLDIAFDHRLGFDQVVRLNPGVDVWVPEPGTEVELPTQWILPEVPREGLVINIPEMRAFDFTIGDDPEVFAIAIGDGADPTPVGRFRVGAKRRDPVWRVPLSIRAERPGLPPEVPPGEENPLGQFWMTLGQTSYGVHGTNIRWSIGRMATHGCIRLYNDQMEILYERIPPGTPVRIVYEPVKLGLLGDEIFVEAHPDIYERSPDPVDDALFRLFVFAQFGNVDSESIDRDLLRRAISEARGIPVRIGSRPPIQGPSPPPAPG
jgi:L,D-transpeptidase ErfK/SrfK